ncbi:MAG: methyltransferase domain-containing protein [Acidimicrobiia bacterium]
MTGHDQGLLTLLACPLCGGEFEERALPRDGHLTCSSCQRVFPVVEGIPRLLVGEPRATFLAQNWSRLAAPTRERLRPEHSPGRARLTALTSRGYSENWRRLYQQLWSRPEAAARSEETSRGTLEKFLGGADLDPAGPTLEVGVGLGRFLRILHKRHPGMALVGIDLSGGVDWVAQVAGPGAASVVQGDILHSPLRAGTFAQCLSFGVLHHTPDPEAAFGACWSALRSGGALHVWVYGDRLRQRSPSLYKASRAVRQAHSRLHPVVLWRLCWLYGAATRALGPVLNRVVPSFPYRLNRENAQRFWMDNLVNPYNFVYGPDELLGWRMEDAAEFRVEPLFGGWVIRARRAG